MKNKNIYPCFWFDNNASEAANFYCSVFPDSHITDENPLVVIFESNGQKFMCLNGGPKFKINPSISIFVVFENEEEMDSAWEKLLESGTVLMAMGNYDWAEKYGWVIDKFGVSWQFSLGNPEDVSGQKFTPCLMFTESKNGLAEKAINYYASIFEKFELTGIWRYSEGEVGGVAGTVKHGQFILNDFVFMAMDSALQHGFEFSEGISIVLECDTQEEIDHYWDKLSAGGREDKCGWLQDQFGVSWQIVPSILSDLMKDPERSGRVVQAFLKMKKFDINTLINA